METPGLKLWLEGQGGSVGEGLGKGKQVCHGCFKTTGSRPAEATASLRPRVLGEAREDQSGDDPGDDQHGLTRLLPLMTLLPNTTRMAVSWRPRLPPPGHLAVGETAPFTPSPQQPARLPRDTSGPGGPSAGWAMGRPWETRPELEPWQMLGEHLI